MFRNYFLITLRTLQKNGVYSFINIFGLSVGIACSIFIMLWVSHELSWDNFHAKRDRLARVYISGQGDNGIYTQMAIPLPLWEALRQNEPGIKHVAPTNWGATYLLTYGDKRLYKQGYYAGNDFLKMFSFPLVHGSPDQQLSDPTTMVLTVSAAKSLFGDEDPIGKIVRVDDNVDLTVTGVVEDVPSNSTFNFECLIPFTTYLNVEPWVKNALDHWGNNSFNLYVEFEENVDPVQVEARVKNIIKERSNEEENVEVTFLPMERWRLYSEFKNGKSVSGNIVYVRMFTIIAVFILIIACINFTNLATARSEKRAREVGIRKSIGSRRKELIMQFMGETFFTTLVAFLIAVGIVEVGLPFYNSIVEKQLSVDYANPYWYAAGLGVIILTGLAAGSYPALYLSAFQPAEVLKGKMHSGKAGAVPRKVLVTLQFFVSIALIIATAVIYFQLHHLKNRPTGYDSNNLVTVPNTGDILKNYNAIKNELISGELASSVTTSNSPITAIYAYNGGLEWSGKREDQRGSFATIGVSHDYSKTMGTTIIEGRDFSPEFTDSTSIILNEAAVAYMGFQNPIGEKIHFWDTTFTVVGVMKDVVMASPARSVDPTVFVFDPSWCSDVTIRLGDRYGAQEAMSKIEDIFRKYNPAYPFVYRFSDQEFTRKFQAINQIGNLANLFSSLAILISCLGLFGLAAFTAEQRTKEIGIRKVLGATVGNVVMLLSKDFTKLVLVSFVIAAPVSAWMMNNWLSQYEYRISIEWWILAGAGSAALLLAIVVVSYQAMRAASANPVTSLRSE